MNAFTSLKDETITDILASVADADETGLLPEVVRRLNKLLAYQVAAETSLAEIRAERNELRATGIADLQNENAELRLEVTTLNEETGELMAEVIARQDQQDLIESLSARLAEKREGLVALAEECARLEQEKVWLQEQVDFLNAPWTWISGNRAS